MRGVGRALLELEPGVDVLGVLPDDDEVQVVAKVARALVRLHRPDERVEVERLPQGDVDAAKTAADRGRDRPLQRNFVLADRFEDVFGERCSEFRDRRLAGLLDVPFELNPGRLEDADGGVADLWTDAVPRDQRYGMPTQSVEVGVSSRLPVFEIVGVDLDEVA